MCRRRPWYVLSALAGLLLIWMQWGGTPWGIDGIFSDPRFPPDHGLYFGKDLDREASTRPRWLDHCNPAASIHRGEEGKPLEGYKLERVMVVTRHGERAPMSQSHPEQLRDISCDVTDYVTRHVLPDAQLARDYITRMRELKDAEPVTFKLNSPFPDTSDCGNAALTARGAIQHLQLGKHFHDVYVNTSLLPPLAADEDIKVFTTHSVRTIQSAMALLTGLYRGEKGRGYKHEPINNTPLCGDEHPGVVCGCFLGTLSAERSGKLKRDKIPEYENAKPEISRLEEEIHKVTTRLEQRVGDVWGTRDVPDPRTLNGYLLAQVCNAGKLTCNKHRPRTCLGEDTLDDMFDLHEKDGRRRSLYPRKATKMMAESIPILLDIIHKARSPASPRFTLYSAHDLTITPLLVTLGLDVPYFPPYAARLVFEIYTKEGATYLKVIYNGNDVTAQVQYQGMDSGPLLDFEIFEERVNEYCIIVRDRGYMALCDWLAKL